MSQPAARAPLEMPSDSPRNPVDENINTLDVETEGKNQSEGEVIIRCVSIGCEVSAWFCQALKKIHHSNLCYSIFTGRIRAAVNAL